TWVQSSRLCTTHSSARLRTRLNKVGVSANVYVQSCFLVSSSIPRHLRMQGAIRWMLRPSSRFIADCCSMEASRHAMGQVWFTIHCRLALHTLVSALFRISVTSALAYIVCLAVAS